ncbi:hypothetical protein, partial [Pseudomonas syringae group genomosp. 3]
PGFSIKMSLTPEGRYVAAGVGLDCASFSAETSAPEFTSDHREMKAGGDSVEILDQISKLIGTVKLGVSLDSVTAKIEHEVKTRASADTQLSARIGSVEARVNQGLGVADLVRDVIRNELQPGGILHRK